MARVMELLRSEYGLNVPKGWIKVMRGLRGRQSQPTAPCSYVAPTSVRQALVLPQLPRQPPQWIEDEESAAFDEREGWDQSKGPFISSNPAALKRWDLREEVDIAYVEDSAEYTTLNNKLAELVTEAEFRRPPDEIF
jgi:hypothetical protein